MKREYLQDLSLKINNLTFNFFLVAWSIIYGTAMIPTIIILPSDKLIEIRKFWIKPILYFLRILFNVSYEIRGLENLKYCQRFIVASKHHSPLDVLLLSDIITKPVFILKKTLLYIPIMGWYLAATKMIPVGFSRRSNGIDNLKKMLKKAKESAELGRTLVIYPEGGRTAVGDRVQYKRGVFFLYKSLKLPVVPVALNAGSIWPIGYFSNKNSGKVVVEILKPIQPGLTDKEFLSTLEYEIENNSNKILKSESISRLPKKEVVHNN